MGERKAPRQEHFVPSRGDGGAGQMRTAWSAGSGVALDSADWFQLVMREYGYLQAVIDKIDGQRFQIRNWTIAAAGILFTASISTKLSLIAFAGVVTTLFFAFLEFICMQQVGGIIKRSDYLEKLIENYQLTGQGPSDYVFGVGQAFVGVLNLRRLPETVFAQGRSHIIVFYLGLMVVAAAGGLTVALL
jgi:hypothetical protein